VAAGQLGSQVKPSRFFPKSTKNKYTITFGSQQHKKYAQTTPLDDRVSSLLEHIFEKKLLY
jgi:hypothetical protein